MTNSAAALSFLKVTAVLAALIAVLQTLIGFGWLSGWDWHGTLGNSAFVVTVLAAIAAFLWSRRTGDKGIFMHAAAMAVLALIQIALGEMGVREVHMVTGVLFLVGSVGLATLSLRRSATAVEAHDRGVVGR